MEKSALADLRVGAPLPDWMRQRFGWTGLEGTGPDGLWCANERDPRGVASQVTAKVNAIFAIHPETRPTEAGC